MAKPKYSNKELEVKRLIHNINERLRKAERQFGGTFITEKMASLVDMFTAGSRAKLNTSTGRIRETEENIRSIAGGRQSLQRLQDIAARIDTQRIITEEIAEQSGVTEAEAQSVAIGNALRKKGHKEINEIVSGVNRVYVAHSRMNDVVTALYEKIPSDEVHAILSDYPSQDVTAPLTEYETKYGKLDIGDTKSLYDFLTYLRDEGDKESYNEKSPYYKEPTKPLTREDLIREMNEMKGRLS